VAKVARGWRAVAHAGGVLLVGAQSLPAGCRSEGTDRQPAEDGGVAAADGGSSDGAAPDPAAADVNRDRCSALEPLVVPAAEPLVSFLVRGSTRRAANQRRGETGACAGLGHAGDAIHQLDLTDSTRPVRVRAIVDADFDALLSLEQGPCEDPAVHFCDRARAARKTSSEWTLELAPGKYQLVVDGAAAGDEGDYRLQIAVEPLDARCEPPHNQTCDTAIPLATDLPTHSVLLPARCRAVDRAQEPLYYRLDLREETAPVGLHAMYHHATEGEPISGAPDVLVLDGSEGCGRLWAPAGFTGDLSTRLEPGEYLLRLQELPEAASILTVQISRPGCPSSTGDGCADAADLSFSDGFARVRGDTYCNTDQFRDSLCSDDIPAPDRFYRVDLRERSERARIRARLAPGELDFHAGLFLLREEDGTCGPVLHCKDREGGAEGWPRFDMVVDPAVYLIGIDGLTQNTAGHFTLEVEVSQPEARAWRPCYDASVDHCVLYDNEVGLECCLNPLARDCGTLFVSCGLHPAVQDCVCQADASCCDGGASDVERCADVMGACHFFCPDEDPSLLACLDDEALWPPQQ